MNKAIIADRISLSYDKRRILKELSFSVNKGEFFVILGPNGSGKTTLLKCILGTLKLQGGTIRVLNKPLRSYSRKELARLVAMVPQEIPTDCPFSVAEIVLTGRSPHLNLMGFEGERDLEIARQAMEFTAISHLANRKLVQLSSGERQRVIISRAICQEPRIILLDEPTASLDLAYQLNIMDLMEKLKEDKGMTVIMVSHDINLGAMYCDRLLLMKHGEAISLGLPSEVLTFEKLEKAYGCVLLVDKHPAGNIPRVTLVPEKFTHNIE